MKKLYLLLVVMALVLMVSACGRNGGDPPPATTATPPATTDTPAPPPATETPPANATFNTLDGLDFGGATLRMAVPWDDGGYRAQIPYFEAAFNVTIEYVTYDWADFSFLVTQGMAGTPIDIVYAHHAFFPDIIISNAVLPLDNYILEGDWQVPGFDGGLSRALTESFNWNGQTFFVASPKAVQIQAMFYNKLMFREAGLDDPLELYNAGQWTWDRFMQMANQVTDPANEIWFSAMFDRIGEWMSFVGVSPLSISGSTITSNIDSTEFFEAVQAYQQVLFGSRAINSPYGDQQRLRDGSVFMVRHIAEVWAEYERLANESSAFGMTSENLGMVPVPIHPLNTAGYPGMTPQGWGAGLGTQHPQAAIAWALFEGTRPKGEFPTRELEAIFEGIYRSQTIFSAPAGFADSEGNSLGSIVNPIFQTAAVGGDIASAINDARPSLERLIADTLVAAGN